MSAADKTKLDTLGASTHLWHLNGDLSLAPVDTAAVAPDGGTATFDGVFYITVPTTITELRGTLRTMPAGTCEAEFIRNRGGAMTVLGTAVFGIGNFQTATSAIADPALVANDIVFARLTVRTGNPQDLTLQLTATP